MPSSPLPTGVVTFLFTDIEGSTRMIRTQPGMYTNLLERHREILREAFADGVEFGTAGDALFYAFDRPDRALNAAIEGQRKLAAEKWKNVVGVKVRMGLSAGSVELRGDDYVGLEVHRVARVCAAAHGGQVVVSQTVRDLARTSAEFDDLGEYALAGLDAPERLFQLVADGLATSFPTLRVASVEPKRTGGFHSAEPHLLSLDDAARRLRAALSEVDPELQGPVTGLAARLFTAARAADYAAMFLGRVDHKRLNRRLKEHHEMAIFSEKASEAAAKIQLQIESVAAVERRAESLRTLTADVPDLLAAPPAISLAAVTDLDAHVARSMQALDGAVMRAVMLVDPLCYKLKRTRHRGVYRDGVDFVVPYVNHLGIDSLRSFDNERDARDFREAVRVSERNQSEHRRDPGAASEGTGFVGGVGG